MPVWKKRWRGASIEVRLPDRLRRPGGPVEAFEPTSTPAVPPPIPRSPQRALDFLRDPALAGDGTRPNPEAQELLTQAAESRRAAATLGERVSLIPWYHTIDLGDGLVTPGNHDHRELVAHVGIPDDLRGLRALDVATFDGFWAFELERRGAEVVAIDLPTVADLDWPRGARDIVTAEALDLDQGEAFSMAALALGSKVDRRACSVYDLDPEELGHFDLVFVGDVLLHLRDPLAALVSVRRVSGDKLIVMDRYEPAISGTGETLLRYRGGWEGLEWWAPSLETLLQWVVDAGFETPTIEGSYRVRGVNSTEPGWQRAVLHTRVAAP